MIGGIRAGLAAGLLAAPAPDTSGASQGPSATASASTAVRPRQPRSTRPTRSATEQRPAPVPESGPGEFRVAAGSSEPVGAGALMTYAVEVEHGLTLDIEAVARTVDGILADPRGWTTVMDRSLQRVSEDPTIRVRIATPETADRLCAPLDTGGRLSCRNGENVVLNAWRWLNGAKTYAGDLASYRSYLVNHEVGHALGNPHETCPGKQKPAPVMLQQTKGLDGCRPNPWPSMGNDR